MGERDVAGVCESGDRESCHARREFAYPPRVRVTSRQPIASSAPTTKLLLLKKQFISHVHPTYDIMFTVRFVTTTPRAYAARNSAILGAQNSARNSAAQFSDGPSFTPNPQVL